MNISLDTLEEEKFEFITKRRGFQRVMDGIQNASLICVCFKEKNPFFSSSLLYSTIRLVDSDIPSIKLNVVVMRHFNFNEVADFVAAFPCKQKVDVRFIEW